MRVYSPELGKVDDEHYISHVVEALCDSRIGWVEAAKDVEPVGQCQRVRSSVRDGHRRYAIGRSPVLRKVRMAMGEDIFRVEARLGAMDQGREKAMRSD